MKNRALFIFILFSQIVFGQTTERLSVYFKSDKYDLDNISKTKIDSLTHSKNIQHITLQGHTDYDGNDEYNDVLSVKRVNEVKAYLLSKHFIENIIEIKALGKRNLLNTNKEETKKALNRRVEVELTIKTKEKPVVKDSIIAKPKLSPYEKEVTITGIVLDDNNKPVIAEISLTDKNGNDIFTTTSGTDGKYQIKTALKKRDDYYLTYYNDESFIASRKINLSQPKFPFKNLKTILPQLKGGSKYILENLNFLGDTSQLIAASLPSLQALHKLMKKNKTLVIRIEGHVNYPNSRPNAKKRGDILSTRYWPPEFKTRYEVNQWLSDERAKMVMNYLIEKGIDAKRVSSIGFSNSQMLFPNATTESEEAQNRRVEINVISFK